MLSVQFATKLALCKTRFFPDLLEGILNECAVPAVDGFLHVPILGTLVVAPKFGAC